MVGTVGENIVSKRHHKYCSAFVSYVHTLDLINVQKIGNIKILSQNFPGGTSETIKTTANFQTVLVVHKYIILHEYLFPHCTT
jgi:hypothetical protein